MHLIVKLRVKRKEISVYRKDVKQLKQNTTYKYKIFSERKNLFKKMDGDCVKAKCASEMNEENNIQFENGGNEKSVSHKGI